ncbi:hypothetical protein HanIR_Chr01g0015611 [Helianthus annuus]|nr:hypothetical protein HanIR_Chr01g0015611 [Helianthus annuus]
MNQTPLHLTESDVSSEWFHSDLNKQSLRQQYTLNQGWPRESLKIFGPKGVEKDGPFWANVIWV